MTANFVGSLFSKSGLPKIADVTGRKTVARQQNQREMDLMLDMFSAEVKRLKAA